VRAMHDGVGDHITHMEVGFKSGTRHVLTILTEIDTGVEIYASTGVAIVSPILCISLRLM